MFDSATWALERARAGLDLFQVTQLGRDAAAGDRENGIGEGSRSASSTRLARAIPLAAIPSGGLDAKTQRWPRSRFEDVSESSGVDALLPGLWLYALLSGRGVKRGRAAVVAGLALWVLSAVYAAIYFSAGFPRVMPEAVIWWPVAWALIEYPLAIFVGALILRKPK